MVSPYQLLVTLDVRPRDGVTVQHVLAIVHPVLRELGYGEFTRTDEGLITAEHKDDAWFMERMLFVEATDGSVSFSVDGTFYFFNPNDQRERLMNVKLAMEKAIPCEATLSRADYPRVTLSALLFSVGPALTGILAAMLIGEGLTRFFPVEGNIHRDVLDTVKYVVLALFASGTVWRKFRRKGLTAFQGFTRLALGYFALFLALYVLAVVMGQ
jgi:hypothetical protein